MLQEPGARQGNSSTSGVGLDFGLQQHSSHINNVITYNLHAKMDANNYSTILWKVTFDFSMLINGQSQASCFPREIGPLLLSQKYLTLYSKPIACHACTCLIQAGAKMDIERDKIDVKEVFVVQIPLKHNMRIGRTCQHMHTGSQDHGPRVYHIVLKTVNNREVNHSYWRVAI